MRNIPIAKSYFDEKEVRRVLSVIRSGWIAQGKMVEEFEKKVARYVGARYAVAVSSGTTALHLALAISKIGAGDEVIVPSFSFIATANSVLYCGARPVFVDIDPKTYNIDPGQIIRFIKDRCRYDPKKKVLVNKATGLKVKAIMPVHQFGLPCDLDAISRIAKRYGLAVIEDAACALGASYKSKRIGGWGNTACFSFHPRKIMTTGEGGMLVTDDMSCAQAARILRNHGSGLSAMKKHAMRRGAPAEDYGVLGYNYRLTDLQAAIGIEQLSKLPKILSQRRRLAERYDKAFKAMADVWIPYVPSYAAANYQSYVIKFAEGSSASRDGVMESLLENGVHARRGNIAIHLQSLYKKMKRDMELPNTEEAASCTIALPIYYGMTGEEQDFVIDRVRHALR